MSALICHPDWNPEVKKALNDFVLRYGHQSRDYDPSAYIVSDSDNTISIFDVEHQRAAYQLQNMAFAIVPEDLQEVLLSGLSDPDLPYVGGTLDKQPHTYREWTQDITDSYSVLYRTYGPFTPAGLSSEREKEVQQNPYWLAFASKMRQMYSLVTKREDGRVSCPWLLYWLQGMSEEEVYQLGVRSHTRYSKVPTSIETWTTPAELAGRIGVVECCWTAGVQVTENMKEMFRVFHENGIKVWVCSASGTDTIRAAIDVFGLHPYVTGLLAMTVVIKDGVYTHAYDYENGCAWLCMEDGSWQRDSIPTCNETQGAGKTASIQNVLCTRYGHGPLAGFGDSSGDFSFCTSFASMKMMIVFNRADRTVRDGGGLLAELAVYQADVLGYDLKTADDHNDILYVLQGRDENNMRTLRSSRRTLRYGESEEKLFADERNVCILQKMTEAEMTTEEILQKYSAVTEDEELGFAYGFLTEPCAYRSLK